MGKFNKYLLTSAAAVLTAGTLGALASPLSAAASTSQVSADSVYTDATIYTVDDKFAVYSDGSIAVKDGRIVWLGETKALSTHVDTSNATVLSVHGQPIYPGLIDSHLHVFKGGLSLTACNLNYQAYNADGLVAAVQSCLDKEGDKTGWLFAVNFDRAAFAAKQGSDVTAEMLAALKTTRPVLIQTMDQHSLTLNAEGLKEVGITCSTPDPTGGRIVRDASGCPAGPLEDGAMLLVLAAIPDDIEVDKEWALASMKMLNSHGITSFMDAAAETRMAEPFEQLRKAGQLTARPTFCMLAVPQVLSAHPGQADETFAKFQALAKNYTIEGEVPAAPGVSWNGIKLVMDGVYNPPSKTAAFLKPYYSYNDQHKVVPDASLVEPYYNVSALVNYLTSAKKHGFKTQIHAIGDWSIRNALDAVEALDYKVQRDDIGIAHFEMALPEDIPRFAKLNLTTIPSPQWAQLASYWKSPDGTYDTFTALGPERIKLAEPFGLVAKEHAKLGQRGNAYGSDWPVDPYDPFLQYFVAVNRRGDPLNNITSAYADPKAYGGKLNDLPGESREEALKAMTINAAHWLGTAKDVGSLEVGKMADFIILERDMVSSKTPASMIGQNAVLLTVVGGNVVYQSDKASSVLSTGSSKSSKVRRSSLIEESLSSLWSPGAQKRDELLVERQFNAQIGVGRGFKKRVFDQHTCGCAH